MTTLAGLALDTSDVSILVNVLELLDANIPGSNLIGTLSDPNSDLTVFAPTNAAFGQLAVDLGFANDPADTAAVTAFLAGAVPIETLNEVVLYHVSFGTQLAAGIAGAGSISTLQGGTIGAMDLPTLVDKEPDIIDPSLIATDLTVDNGVVHLIDRVLLPVDLPGNDVPTITGTVLASGTGFDTDGGDFDILREAVVAADLAGTLDNTEADLTVFAPTDAGFVALSQTLGYGGSDEAGAFDYIVNSLRLLSGSSDPIPLLTTILTCHVAGESLQASQVLAAGAVTALQGSTLTLDGLSLVDADPDLPNPSLIATDIQASNGIIHALDGVLIPVDLFGGENASEVDFIIGDNSRSSLTLGLGDDYLDAKGGNDVVFGGAGKDVILGEAGSDRMHGGRGEDLIKGEDGNDRIFGNQGDDLLWGGRHEDVFVFEQGDGHDLVFDFRAGEDKIDLTAFDLEVSDLDDVVDKGFFITRLDLADTTVSLFGWSASRIDADDFIL